MALIATPLQLFKKSAGQSLIQIFADPMQQDVVPAITLTIQQTFIVQNVGNGAKGITCMAQRGEASQNLLFPRARRQMNPVPRGETKG